MIAIALAAKIASLLLILASGFALVKTKLLRSEDSHLLSIMSLYLFSPCAILYSTQVDITPDVIQGLGLALVAAICVQGTFILLSTILAKILRLSVVEKLSIIYTNSANLIIPLIIATLGPEWVIYSVPFSALQTVLMWSHGKSTLEETKSIEVKKILTNVNMVAIFACIPIMAFGIKFPGFVADAIMTFGTFLGPACMLTSGMLIASTALKKAFGNKRVWLTAALRLIIVPVSCVLALKLIAPYIPVANASSVLLITALAAVAPSASMVVQMSQVYGKDPNGAANASAINTCTLICCIVTMPLMIALYQLPF